MGFMDKVKDTAKQVGDAAKDATKTGQDKIEELQIKKRISGLHEELGAVVHAQRSGRPVPGTDASFEAAVDRLVAAIDEQEAALAAVGVDEPGAAG